MGLILMVLGFMWWWPLGLIILAALIANGRIGYRRHLQFAGSGPTGEWDHLTRMDRMGKKADRGPAKTTACVTASEGIGGVNHQAAIVRSTTIALRRCAVSKMSNASSRNS
jgi:hypothetical protein